MSECYRAYPVGETIYSESGVTNATFGLWMEGDAADALDRVLEPYGLNSYLQLTRLNLAFQAKEWWPWAIVFLDAEYLITEQLVEARGNHRDCLFAVYSNEDVVPDEELPPVSMLLFETKGALERLSKSSEVFARCWKVLSEAPAGNPWFVILDPLPEEWPRRLPEEQPAVQ